MKTLRIFSFCFVALGATRLVADDFLDQVDDALTMNAFHGNVRTRVSGSFDLEFFQIDQPPPGLIETNQHFLVNPRLSLFLDSQIGTHVYVFGQSRIDTGFDPTDHGVQVRLDEYAVRYTPWEDGWLSLQIGKFASVVGNWIPRHLSWENPFITAPLPYENITRIEDKAAPYYGYFAGGLTDAKYKSLPVIWGPSYASGVSVAGGLGHFDYAVEIKNAALSSRPESWSVTEIDFEHPTVSARLGFRPSQMWNFGFSASDGAYFRPEAGPTLPVGQDIGDYHERVLGQDIGFAWHHLELWAEFYEARFQVPLVGNADTFAYYLEGKYKFTPQLFGAMRWNQQLFANVSDGAGGSARWGQDLWRIDASIGYRFTAHTQLKLQYSFQDANSNLRDLVHTLAAQFTVRF